MVGPNCQSPAAEDPKSSLKAVETVCRRVLDLQPEDDCTVELFSDRFYVKLYLVVIPSRQQRFVLRTNMDPDPHETMGEVAALEWVRHFTDIPVHHVIAFDSSSDNELGFEWLLMPFIAGTAADEAWGKLSMTAKEKFTKEVAEFQAELLNASETKSRLRGIGSLTSPFDFEKIGQFSTEPCEYGISQGPFHSSRELVHSILQFVMFKAGSRYLCTQDDEFISTIERQLQTAESLLELVPTVFPAIDQPEQTVISKDSLYLNDFLVDEEGAVTAVLGWQGAPAVPCYLATELPEFLTHPIWPTHDVLAPAGSWTAERRFSDVIRENQKKWKDRMAYEQTQLRKIYTERMEELRPTWDAEVAGSALKIDFINAASRCGDKYFLSRIETWIRAIKNGENLRLNDVPYTQIEQEPSHGDVNPEGE